MARVRTNDSPLESGNWQRFGATTVQNVRRLSETCEDIVAAGDGNPFRVNRIKRLGGIINTRGSQSYYSTYFRDCPAFGLHSAVVEGFLPIAGSPSDIAAATTAAARTNPSKAHVDLPTAIFELKDLPGLFKLSGDSIIAKAGSQYLAVAFGWAPMVSDLMKLTEFNERVAKRAKRLYGMSRRPGSKYLIEVFSGSAQSSFNLVAQSTGSSISVPGTKVGTEVVTCFARWRPSAGSYPLAHDKSLELARKAVLGLTVDPKTAWELMPWSWLFDYAFNVGEYLAASRNIVGMELSGPILVMRRKTTVATTSAYDSGTHYMSPISVTYDQKYRAPASPSITGQLPFLNSGQMSIVGSLVASRYGFLYGKRPTPR